MLVIGPHHSAEIFTSDRLEVIDPVSILRSDVLGIVGQIVTARSPLARRLHEFVAIVAVEVMFG